MSETLDEIKKQILECINSAYDRGYKNGLNDGNINDGTFAVKVKEAYDNGLNDAWVCARKILDAVVPYDYWDIGSGNHISNVIRHYSADEAIQKIKEYEDKQKKADDEIHVGDEVYCLNPKHKYVVLGFLDNGKIFVFSGRGLTGAFSSNQVHKTGRNYPIMEILEKLNQLNESEGSGDD